MEFYKNPFNKVLSALHKQLRRTQGPFIVAIDGACCSGKTTLAQALGQALQAPVFHMDDFYLPFALRTPQRLQMPGGHMDWERLAQEKELRLRCWQNSIRFHISLPEIFSE